MFEFSRSVSCIAVLAVFGALLLGPASAGAADPRVKRALEKEGLKYDVDEEGDFRVIIAWTDDDRSQLTFVNSSTEVMGDAEIREVWSVAYAAPEGTFPSRVAMRLLEDNPGFKIGAWELGAREGELLAVFNAKIPADASSEYLAAVIRVVSATADNLETELLDTDEF